MMYEISQYSSTFPIPVKTGKNKGIDTQHCVNVLKVWSLSAWSAAVALGSAQAAGAAASHPCEAGEYEDAENKPDQDLRSFPTD